jgi:hypothetical protein
MGIIQACCFSAVLADEVDVIIMMMSLRTVLPAQRISCCIISRWNGMNDTIVNESLQCPVNGDPVKLVARDFLNIMMGQRVVRLKKNLQDRPSAVRVA